VLFLARMPPKALLVGEVVRFGEPESVNQGAGAANSRWAEEGREGAGWPE